MMWRSADTEPEPNITLREEAARETRIDIDGVAVAAAAAAAVAAVGGERLGGNQHTWRRAEEAAAAAAVITTSGGEMKSRVVIRDLAPRRLVVGADVILL